jgi:ribosome-associated heat shock protein Hsp15
MAGASFCRVIGGAGVRSNPGQRTDNGDMPQDALPPRMRLDKWLWAARLFKTRSLATQAIDLDRVRVNHQAAKPARDLRAGDLVSLKQQGGLTRILVVRSLSAVRGPAAIAQGLYEETPESVAERARSTEQRRLMPEPAAAFLQGRPTKRDRRQLDHAAEWQRWSAKLDVDS